MDNRRQFWKIITKFKVKYGEDLSQNSGNVNKRRN